MTWTPLPVVPRIIPCEPPYSFYFRLIEPLWRAPAADDHPLHRLATLARKQDAKALIIEDAAADLAVSAEIDGLDESFGGGGAAEALKLSFLSEWPDKRKISSVSDNCLIGQCILVNYRAPGTAEFELTFIYEALFRTPRLNNSKALLNNFINCEAAYEVEVAGRIFQIDGICYSQQNGVTSVCAHSAARMVFRTLFPERILRTCEINEIVDVQAAKEGMFPGQIVDVLRAITGRNVMDVDCTAETDEEGDLGLGESDGGQPREKRKALTAAEYVSVLTAATDSGDIALLIFKTGQPAGDHGDLPTSAEKPASHVVLVFGHTRNSDEWHPQALPEYSGLPSAPYCPAGTWVDHFVIHDDNFGPYYTLSSRALESDPTVTADRIIIVQRNGCSVEAHAAEAAASIFLSWMLPNLAIEEPNQWLDYITRRRIAFVTRPVLVTREEYAQHLGKVVAHDGSRMMASADSWLEGLPESFWMVEFTLPDLYTGNRAKLGEVIVEAHLPEGVEHDSRALIRGMRVPSRALLRSEDGALDISAFPIASHCPVFKHKEQGHEW